MTEIDLDKLEALATVAIASRADYQTHRGDMERLNESYPHPDTLVSLIARLKAAESALNDLDEYMKPTQVIRPAFQLPEDEE